MTTTQTLHQFLTAVQSSQPISFEQTMLIIDEHYHFTPITFKNGLGNEVTVNPAGSNSGSCKIFAFARLHSLNQQQTLELFGDYYHIDVLNDPNGSSHANIRTFIKYGWAGIKMPDNPLQLRD